MMTNTPITNLCSGILHRAIVELPDRLCEPDRPIQSRIVFFESPTHGGAIEHLEKLLVAAWCTTRTDWDIYNVGTVRELYGHAAGAESSGELRLFETGAGGDERSVGPDRVHYARAWDVDFFVTPRVAARLLDLSGMIEQMYADKDAAQ